MTILMRASDEPVASRLDYWRHAVGDTIVPFDLRIDAPADFESRILTGDVGAVRVAELATLPGEVLRTPKLIRRSDPELCKIDVQVRGRTVVEQDGRRATMEPGDFTFVDLSRPCRWVTSSAEVVAVMFPRAMLPIQRKELAELTAVPFSGLRGPGALVFSLVRRLVHHLHDYDASEGARLGAAVLDLLTVALTARLDRPAAVSPETRQLALLASINAHIEQRLGDPELSPASIAAAHHISLRYLQKLFAAQGLTVSSLIRRRRLERCRRDLLDPALRIRPVSAIAARWGFPNAVHFNRTFRDTYDLPPGEFRRRCNTADAR